MIVISEQIHLMNTLGSHLNYYEVCSFAAGIAGNIFAFVLFISPIPTFKRIIKSKSTEQFSGSPYIYSLLNCLISGWYGLPWVTHGAILVATVNSSGALFQLFYCIIFIIYSEKGKKINSCALLVGVLCAFAFIVYVSLELLEGKARQNFVGYLSILSLVSMFASPLAIFSLVIRTKSVEFMPFHLSLAGFLMSISFFAYGILLHDLFISIPNGIGTALGTMQLLFYSYYSNKAIEQYKLPLIV